MFVNKTVFILGAGASWHYGLPTGEALVGEVRKKARLAAKFFKDSRRSIAFVPKFVADLISPDNPQPSIAWTNAARACAEFEERLQAVDPPVIDYFLGQNPHLAGVGRLLIAWVILECGEKYKVYQNINRPENERSINDNWCRFILSRLASGCEKSSDLLNNDVHFITFNYDLSLENKISAGLWHTALFSGDVIEEFFANDRIVHVYGDVGQCKLDYSAFEIENAEIQKWKILLDHVYEASVGIRTIAPHEKEADQDGLRVARKKLAEASCVYILGFGFDEQNCSRLGFNRNLKQTTKAKPKSVFYTNYGDMNRVNKSASKQFFNKWDLMGPGQFVHGDMKRGWFFEKSIKNCYEALDKDFGTAESELISTSTI